MIRSDAIQGHYGFEENAAVLCAVGRGSGTPLRRAVVLRAMKDLLTESHRDVTMAGGL